MLCFTYYLFTIHHWFEHLPDLSSLLDCASAGTVSMGAPLTSERIWDEVRYSSLYRVEEYIFLHILNIVARRFTIITAWDVLLCLPASRSMSSASLVGLRGGNAGVVGEVRPSRRTRRSCACFSRHSMKLLSTRATCLVRDAVVRRWSCPGGFYRSPMVYWLHLREEWIVDNHIHWAEKTTSKFDFVNSKKSGVECPLAVTSLRCFLCRRLVVAKHFCRFRAGGRVMNQQAYYMLNLRHYSLTVLIHTRTNEIQKAVSRRSPGGEFFGDHGLLPCSQLVR